MGRSAHNPVENWGEPGASTMRETHTRVRTYMPRRRVQTAPPGFEFKVKYKANVQEVVATTVVLLYQASSWSSQSGDRLVGTVEAVSCCVVVVRWSLKECATRSPFSRCFAVCKEIASRTFEQRGGGRGWSVRGRRWPDRSPIEACAERGG